jgi:glycosyltransferase involved in cell wall biosynthesis
VERGVPAHKITVVTNGVDLSRYAPRPPDEALLDELGQRGRFVVGYIGTHGMAHGLSTIVQAAAKLQDHPIGQRCFFLFVGGGADRQRLMDEARTLGLRNVRFVESVSKEQVVRYWSVLDVTVMHLLDKVLFSTVIPSKMFEGMAMGIPALSAVPGEAREILEESKAGHYFRAQDSDDFIRVLLDLMSDPDQLVQMKVRCVQAARLFDRTNLATAMAQALVETVQSSIHRKVG